MYLYQKMLWFRLGRKYSFVGVWENQFDNKFEIDAFISFHFVILYEKIMGFDFHKKKIGGSREIQTWSFCNILFQKTGRRTHNICV